MPQTILKTDETHNGSVSRGALLEARHPALRRLAGAVEHRDSNDVNVNYSRMHHRHARSHTRQ